MFYLVQAGDTINVVTEAGSLYQTLTMPTGVTIDPTKRARYAVINQKVYIANAVSENVWVDPATFTVYRAAIQPPTVPIGLTTLNGSGPLTGGAYAYAYTFAQFLNGVLVSESPLYESMTITVAYFDTLSGAGVLALTGPGPWFNPDPSDYQSEPGEGGTFTLTSGDWEWTLTIPVDTTPGTATNARRVYRTANGGSEYFHDFDILDNVTTSATDTHVDAQLDLVAFDFDTQNPQAGTAGNGAFGLFISYKNQLMGVPNAAAAGQLTDHLQWSDPSQPWKWAATNDIPFAPVGADLAGITGLASRRNDLVVFKTANCWKLTGSSVTDFAVVAAKTQVGCIAPDSVITIDDITYWLGADGVYAWDDNDGITCITRDSVDPWFTDDAVSPFDRTQFPAAWASWNPITNCLELSLVPVGGSVPSVWIAYELTKHVWFGPHVTAAFLPTGRALLRSSSGTWRPMMGDSNGYLYAQDGVGTDDVSGVGTHYAVATDWTLQPMFEGDATLTYYWGECHVTFAEQASGVTLTMTVDIGDLNSDSAVYQTFTVTIPMEGSTRQRLRRLGLGATCQLRFQQNATGAAFLLYGLDVDPVFIVGRRT
jgi:hypothetical protein